MPRVIRAWLAPAQVSARRRVAAFAVSAALAVAAAPDVARADGGWLPSTSLTPLEQRVAVAVGPTRTTTWTSLHFDAPGGPFAVVIPVPVGAALDISSDAWLEALEVATAPRVFPDGDIRPVCPGATGPEHPFHVAGATGHVAAVVAAEIGLLADSPAVEEWAVQRGLLVAPAVSAVLSTMQSQFLVARFVAPGGTGVTPTFRIAVPGGSAALPLVLTAAGPADLQVTAWIVGPTGAALGGAQPATVAPEELVWNAQEGTSNWADARADALIDGGPLAALVEARSADALAHDVSIADGTARIVNVVETYFERAAGYASIPLDSEQCSVVAAAALASRAVVASSCPRADLGVVAGLGDCVEVVAPGQVDPTALRCGEMIDDLAVALSGIAPNSATITRIALRIPAGKLGTQWPLMFDAAPSVTPVWVAKALDLSGCASVDPHDIGASSNQGSSEAATAPRPASVEIWVDTGCSCDGTIGSDSLDPRPTDDGLGGEAATSESETVDAADTTDDCGGDSSDSSGAADDCSGDSSDSSGAADDCSGDSSSGGDSSNGDSCGSGTESAASGDSCGDSCGSGSSSGDSCSSNCGSDECTVAGRANARGRRPRVSAMTFMLALVLLPLRRWRRRGRLRHS